MPYVGHDAWAILLVVDQLKGGHGYNGVSKYFLIQGDHDYPPLFFYFLSLFPLRLLKKYNSLINPILDTVNATILFLVSFILTQNLLVSFTAGVIYSLTPIVLEESFILSTRFFGMILLNCVMVGFTLFQSSKSPELIVFVVVGGILILLSHKFAAEVLGLLLLSFAIIDWSYAPLAALLFMILGACLFSGGFYLKILRGQLGINRFWLRHYKDYGATYVRTKDDTGSGSEIPKELGDGTESPVRRFWRKTKRVNPLYWLLSLSPFNPFSLVVVLIPFFGIERAWEWTLAEWSILTLVFYYAATYLRFLGHYAGRSQFLEYNAFPSALMCATFIWSSFSYWKLAIVAVALVLSLIQNGRSLRRVRVHSRSDDQTLLEEIFDYLRRSPKDGVLCLPASHTYAIPFFTGKKVFYTMSARNYEKLAAFFPVLTVPLHALSREYGINFIIVDRTIVPVGELDLSDFRLVMDRNDYLLFEKTPEGSVG